MRSHYYFVYIMASISRNLYVGVTNNMTQRTVQHKLGRRSCYTKRYRIGKLVYYETYTDIDQAIKREKQLKGWLRVKKIALIEKENPSWRDLSHDWFGKIDKQNQ